MADRPNILVLVNDHQAYYRHGWDGGVRPLTPNFDRLADGGIRFDRSYAAVPLCGPSRRTLVTGLYPHNHNNYYNYSHAPYDHDVYLDILARNDYRCYFFGKWHAGAGNALDFGCEGFSMNDYGNPYTSQAYHDYLERKGLPPAEHYIERIFDGPVTDREFPHLKVGVNYRCDRHWCGEQAVGLTITPKETHEAFFLADLACDQLEQIAASASDEPFHLRVDFWGPHQPFFPTQEFADLYNPDEIEEYGSFRDTLEGKSEIFRHDMHRPLTDAHGNFLTPSPLPWSEWQKVLARVYAHITMIDAAGGLILDRLEQLGLAENTLVIWTTDHGDAVASHGGRFDKGSYLTEEVMRVPLAMRLPGKIEPGQTTNALACGTDLAPTILDAAGLRFSHRVDGESLLPVAMGEQVTWRDSLLVETQGHGFGMIEPGRALYAGRYKLVVYQDQGAELYDLSADPYELKNLYADPAYREIVEVLHQKLRHWQEQTEDHDFPQAITEAFREEDLRKFRELLARRVAWNNRDDSVPWRQF